MEANKFTYTEFFKVVSNMNEDKREFFLTNIEIPALLKTLNSEEEFESLIKELDEDAAYYQLMASYLLEVKSKLDSGKYRTTGAIDKDTISEKYDVLDEDEKKQIVLNLINNPDFQKKCCEIMSCDMKRNINADDTLKALDQLFNFGKYIDEFIEAGIGCDHEYRIE